MREKPYWLERLREHTKINRKTGCWEWTGKKNIDGYGVITFYGKYALTHRLSYQLRRGEIGKGLCVCHKCDNRPCINPRHLFIGTRSENSRDCYLKGRVSKGETHGASKLKAVHVVEIRRRLKSGDPPKEIAYDYGISIGNVSAIKTGKTWRDNDNSRMERG